eukprot:SAG25_NODE_459_length_7828_cov_24.263907_3_plen_131_part_00
MAVVLAGMIVRMHTVGHMTKAAVTATATATATAMERVVRTLVGPLIITATATTPTAIVSMKAASMATATATRAVMGMGMGMGTGMGTVMVGCLAVVVPGPINLVPIYKCGARHGRVHRSGVRGTAEMPIQ